MTIYINGRAIGPNYPPYVIAELSANHNGSLERALKTIDMAKQCGCLPLHGQSVKGCG